MKKIFVRVFQFLGTQIHALELWKTQYNAGVTCHQSHALFSYP